MLGKEEKDGDERIAMKGRKGQREKDGEERTARKGQQGKKGQDSIRAIEFILLSHTNQTLQCSIRKDAVLFVMQHVCSQFLQLPEVSKMTE